MLTISSEIRVEGLVCNVDLFRWPVDPPGELVDSATLSADQMCSGNLAGGRFTTGLRLDFIGRKTIMFPFPVRDVVKNSIVC